MQKLSAEKKRVIFLTLMVLAGSVFTLLYMILNGNTDQIYNDIIVEYTSIFSSNKSAEKNLLFILIFAGIVIYLLFFIISKRIWKSEEQIGQKIGKSGAEKKSNEFLCALIMISVTSLLFFGKVYQVFFAALLYALVLYMIKKELVYSGVCTFYLGVYAWIGLYRLYVISGGTKSLNSTMIVILSLGVSLIPIAFANRRKAIVRLGMIENVMIPGALFIYLSNRYKTGEEIVTIDVSDATKLIMLFLIGVFVAEAIYVLVKKWNIAEKIEDVITIGSCVTMMAFNRFDGAGAIMSTDIHHPFENIIGFSQVFKLGQTPFKDYIPVSGMYSMIQGAVFEVFGDSGTFANYAITNNLFYLFVIILIVCLLRTQLDSAYVLLISVIFYVQTYNRLAFMLPIMLLLVWPRLIQKRNAWLITWFLSSLFQGLYYPLYGAATCVAFFPLLIWQIVTFVKSGELKRSMQTVKFWAGWGICAVLLLACTGYLLGTLKHMLAMSSQSTLANGISRFGQLVPDSFFPYLTHFSVRIGLYYIFTFMIPVTFVWIAFSLALKTADISYEGKKLRIGNGKTACIIASAVIMPVICYTYTFTRLDVNSIYARSAGVLFAGMVLILVFTWNYIGSEKLRYIFIMLMVAIPVIANTKSTPSLESDSKLAAYYMVPEGYIYVEDDIVEKLGVGFIEQDMYNNIEATYARFADKDSTLSYMGDPAYFGYFYLLDIKGDGAMEITETVKSLSAAEEMIDIARANNSIIAPSFIPYYNYYLYHWLLASGEYVWDTQAQQFMPNDGTYTREEIIEQNKNIGIAWNNMEIGKTAGSWGSSMESLEEIFSEPGIKCSTRIEEKSVMVDFEEPFDGDTADYIYLEFADMDENYECTLYNLLGEVTQVKSRFGNYFMKKNYNPNMTVQVGWQDDNGEIHTMNCAMSKGKLLIPVGAGLKWLFNQHSYISITVYQDGNEIVTPEISSIRLLKLREAK